ncbi:Fe-S cluster assembly protein SufD [Ligilactobacillus saerimneri]|uniref:Fe-S cluster assembly protein SufD n=1 Tax=Ligilactobacillus saerimneri TaxID=228229 RepID=UPI00040E727D|nr:Fe-S cluster assembly protein SufD [Ligilactobacillus saerimneri]
MKKQANACLPNSTTEPTWFKAYRQQALQASATLARPVFERIDYHRWPIALQQFDQATSSLEDTAISSDLYQDNTFVWTNKHTQWCQLAQKWQAQGVIMCDWHTALTKHADLIQKYYGKTVKWDENQLTAQHAAWMQGGLFIYVPRNVQVTEPLVSYLIQDARTTADFVPHVLIVAAENSSLTYLENLQTIGSKEATANIIVEVVARPGSHVNFASSDRLGPNTTAYLNRRATVERDARIDWSMGMMNDGNTVGDFDSDLVGNGAHAEVKIVAMTSAKQVQGIDSRVTNKAPNTIGHILQHGVILGKSQLIFNGIGHILHGAKGADAQQESRVLMLSKQGRGDANPILLIDDNDVTAGHAASVGRIDEEQMYYLMSRGLSKELAERLVIRGFLGPVLNKIPDKHTLTTLEKVCEQKLIEGQKNA